MQTPRLPRALSRRLLGRDVERTPSACMRTPLHARGQVGGGGIFFNDIVILCLEVTVLLLSVAIAIGSSRT